jgi:hypothetical protein
MTDPEIAIYAAAVGGPARQQVAQGMKHVRERYQPVLAENMRLQMLVAELYKQNAMLTDAVNAARERAIYSA